MKIPLRPVLGLGLAALLFGAGALVNRSLGLELSTEDLAGTREWIEQFGWVGALVYVAMVSFRSFLLLPSALVLVLGGLAFGALEGTALGAAGLFVSGHVQYGLARLMGDEWVRRRVEGRLPGLDGRLKRGGAWLVGLMTAHPAGPLTPVNMLAGLGALPLLSFSIVVALAVPIRAGAYALLGNAALEWGLARSALVAVALAAVALLPLLIPRVRATLLGGEATLDESSASSSSSGHAPSTLQPHPSSLTSAPTPVASEVSTLRKDVP